MLDHVGVISNEYAKKVVEKHHYSKVMPRITKFSIGGFKDNKVVAVCTLGYGVRPYHTIKKIFPSLEVKDYLEIGKLCVTDEMPKNTESFFISKVIKLVKGLNPELKILFSWADGIIGKPGYVYQASNFYYGGYIWTEMYLDEKGNRVHPRTLQGVSVGEKGDNKYKSRSFEVTQKMGYTKYFGLQFRYMYPLCNKKEIKLLLKESPYEWKRKDYPKDVDCKWKKQLHKGKHVGCDKPPFITTNYIKEDKGETFKLFFQ